ncbi:MAG TPA: NADH-quinone oxidoreductase subunit M [Gemmata sp.]|nr:NADH-quinone oxidoreductase subunit M [Gemmata sp.]
MEKLTDLIADPRTARTLVLLVVLVPLFSAIILSVTGRGARRVALWLAVLHLALVAALVGIGYMLLQERAGRVGGDGEVVRFEPLIVPGDAGGKESSSYRTKWNLLDLSTSAVTGEKATPSVQFYLGVDGLNLWLVALASFMMLPAILVSWESATDRPGAFFGWLFLLEGGLIGAFLSFDVILFYVFFELTLVPTFFLIGRWGMGSGRRDAARKFFLYTLAGSLLTLIGIVGVVLTNPNPDTGQITFSLPDLMANVQLHLNQAHAEAIAGKPEKLASLQATQCWLFVALMAGFMVKVPVWPFHTWLPSAYGESPIGVTVTLAALMAKLGTFGILRFVLPLTPDAAIQYGLPAVGTFAAFGIVYAAFCAYDQKDMKLLIAYSSVSHLGIVVLAIFAFNSEGISGAALHMVNHGLSTGALFAVLAFLLDRYRTTQTSQYSGLMGRFPNYALLVFAVTLASIGLPGFNNFVSEMLMLAGLFDARNPGIHQLGLAVIGAFAILLSAWYMLTMLQKVFFNPPKTPEPIEAPAPPRDLNRREWFAFGSLAALCLLIGLVPQPILDSMRWDVRQMEIIGDRARERVRGVADPKAAVASTRNDATGMRDDKAAK